MSHKIFYALTKEKRELFQQTTKNIDESIYQFLINVTLSTFNSINNGSRLLPDGREMKFKAEKIDAIKIPLTTAEYRGQKSVLVCSEGTYLDLINACKLDNYLRSKEGGEMISFNQFITNLVNNFIDSVIIDTRKKTREADMKQILAESGIKKKK